MSNNYKSILHYLINLRFNNMLFLPNFHLILDPNIVYSLVLPDIYLWTLLGPLYLVLKGVLWSSNNSSSVDLDFCYRDHKQNPSCVIWHVIWYTISQLNRIQEIQSLREKKEQP